MNLPTNGQIIKHYKAMCNSESCKDRLDLNMQLQESGNLCAIFLESVRNPTCISQIMADSILIGIAIAESRQLEELAKL